MASVFKPMIFAFITIHSGGVFIRQPNMLLGGFIRIYMKKLHEPFWLPNKSISWNSCSTVHRYWFIMYKLSSWSPKALFHFMWSLIFYSIRLYLLIVKLYLSHWFFDELCLNMKVHIVKFPLWTWFFVGNFQIISLKRHCNTDDLGFQWTRSNNVDNSRFPTKTSKLATNHFFDAVFTIFSYITN